VKWKISNDLQLARYFEGQNVWSQRWEQVIDEKAEVVDHREILLTLTVWEASFGKTRKKFAAGEMSSNVWIFALPQS